MKRWTALFIALLFAAWSVPALAITIKNAPDGARSAAQIEAGKAGLALPLDDGSKDYYATMAELLGWFDTYYQRGRLTEGITQKAFTAEDATPDVTGAGTKVARYWKTGGVVTITDFDDGTDHTKFGAGDWFVLEFAHAATIDCSSNANIYCNRNQDYTATVGDVILWQYNGAKWVAIGGSGGGGAAAGAYDADTWNGDTNAPTKDAVRDKFETLGTMSVQNAGTLTNGYYCTYVTGTGIVCNTQYTTASNLAITSEARGDLLARGASTWGRLAKGTEHYPLVAGASDPAYAQLTAAGIADTTITGGKLANNTITATQIANDTVTATQLAAALSFADADFVDLSAITMSAGKDEGLAIPTWANVAPATITKYFVTWDTSSKAIKVQDGGSWYSFATAAAPIDSPYLLIGANDATLTADRRLALGAGISGTDAGANSTYTVALNLAGLTDSQTLWDGSQATRTLTANISGTTDPVITFSDGVINVSAGALQVGGTAVQKQDAELSALAGLTSAADKLPYFTGSGTAGLTDLTAFARTILDDADAAAARTTIGAQQADTELTALAGLTSAANKLPYFTGSGTAAVADLTAFARTILDDADAATVIATIGAQTSDATLTALAGLTITSGSLVYGTGTDAFAVLAAGTQNKVLQMGATNPGWSAYTLPASVAQGDLWYGSGTNAVSALTKDANATRYLSNTGTSNNPAWAQINLSNGVTNTLGAANGGTGISTASSTGVPSISSGTWSVAATLANTLGGTGQNSSAWTGIVQASSGTWSASTTLAGNYSFTGSPTFGDADTDYVALRSVLRGSNNRAVWINSSAASPGCTNATAVGALCVADKIESKSSIHGTSIDIAGSSGTPGGMLIKEDPAYTGSNYRGFGMLASTDYSESIEFKFPSGNNSANAFLLLGAPSANVSNMTYGSFSTDNFAVGSNTVTIKDGGVAVAELVAGETTPDNTKYYRGDGTWQAISAAADQTGGAGAIQWNNSGTFGSDTGFTYVASGGAAKLSLGKSGSTAEIALLAETGATDYVYTLKPSTSMNANVTTTLWSSALVQGDIVVASAANQLGRLADSATAGNPLVSGGSGGDPSYLSVVLAGGSGTNTFSVTNGTASLDVAAGATLNIDTSLTVQTGAVTLTGNASGSTLVLPAGSLSTGVQAGNLLVLPADPGAHTLFGFDNTSNTYKPITIGSGLSFDQPTTTLSASGGGGLSASGTPTNHQWAVWTDASTIKGASVTASKVACSNADGDPVACTNLTDVAAITTSSEDTLTNKTLDANGTGNTIKGTSEIQILGSAFRRLGAGVGAPATTQTAFNYGLPKFANATDEATNYVDYVINVPADIDTSVALTATLTFYLGGADTGDHDYVLSMCNPAASAAAACTPGNAINLTYTADGSGADGDVEYTASTTLTDWAGALTAGRQWLIRLARDGDDATNDASTVDSYPQVISIKYGYTN